MELLFLWIDDFRKLSKLPLRLTSEFFFSFEPDSNKPDRFNLEVTFNTDYISPFNAPLVNVTAIAGSNGSGKSSIMNCLKLLYGDLSILTSRLIFVFADKERKEIHTCYYGGGARDLGPIDVHVVNANSKTGDYQILSASPYTVKAWQMDDRKIGNLTVDMSKIACAFMTNNFDYSSEKYYDGIINMSVKHRLDTYLDNYLKKQEGKVEKRAREKKKDMPTVELFPTHLKDYYKQELRSNIRFIAYANNRKRGKLPEIPRNIVVSFNFEDYEQLIDDQSNAQLLMTTRDLQILHGRIPPLLSQESNKRKVFINLVYLCAFYYGLRNGLFKENFYTSGDISGAVASLAAEEDNLFNALKGIVDRLSLETGQDEKTLKIQELLGEKLERALDQLNFDFDPIYKNQIVDFPFAVSNSLWSLLDLIYDFQYGEGTGFLDFRFEHDLSTGEQARLNNYSRLFEIRRKATGKFVVLLVDEGDLYYHPQWQKHYLSDFIEGVEFLFGGMKVQLLLTTHSPFILSDIPRQDIIFMKRSVNKLGDIICSVSPSEDHVETFGANIHELFTDSFFLNDGLMGEYARIYIQNLIREINKEETISRDRFEKHYKNRISIIGEQFLKSKIIELVVSKCEPQLMDSVIDTRENELGRLKLIRDRRLNDKD